MNPSEIPVVILAGGRGTRLMEETTVIPKPMVTVGGKPILWHIMKCYSAFGFRRFVICLGYKGHIIKEYFLDLLKHTASLKINAASGQSEYLADSVDDWEISLIETGENSLTGTRLQKVGDQIDAPHFCLTYGDGLANVDLDKLVEFHEQHGRLGTVTAVHPPSRFGTLELEEDGGVRSFQEKQPLQHDYINGGFFMFRREFLGRLPAVGNYSLEAEPLVQLARDGQLCAFRHDGFWQCMDTLRDRETLEALFGSGYAPWAV
jgi:glucose-1-phosphate cytidylyltransferase